jgi:uracil-DNA glycosylase
MTLPSTTIDMLLDQISTTLKHLSQNGCRGFDCQPETLARISAWGSPPAPAKNLAAVRQELGDCRRCGLSQQRTHIVFGTGNPNARLIFVGEGPGHEEDQSGEPFVGPAGQLLTKIIKAMHLTRAEVYIANIIKCRPPANRNPDEDEIVTCMPFVKRQIDAIKPDYIVALGKVAAQSLLGNREPISRLRGKFYDFSGIKLMPTYHPAYLLRNPAKKREVWNDMQRLMKEMAHED